MLNEKLVVLVMGRDQTVKLSYLTSLFINLNWKDREYKCVLVTQTKAPENHKYDDIIKTKPEAIWGERLDLALQLIDCKYILLSQEDFFISRKINSEHINQCVKCMEENQLVSAIRLTPFLFKASQYDESFDEIEKGMPYRMCGQPTIFRKEYLQQLAVKHFNPWQFEIDGSDYSNKLNGIVLVSKEDRYPYVHAWTKGAWTRDAIRLMKDNGIEKSLYNNDEIYPIYKEWMNGVWKFCFKLFPKQLTELSKKKNRIN